VSQKTNTDAIGGAKRWNQLEVVLLLERFKENPEQTRYNIWVELGLQSEIAAEMFALVVFASGDEKALLQIIQRGENQAASRFFKIAQKLPIELQMMLCYRLIGLGKKTVLSKDSEPAFKALAAKYWPPSPSQSEHQPRSNPQRVADQPTFAYDPQVQIVTDAEFAAEVRAAEMQ